MKYKVFIILLLSRIYSTDVIVNGIKIAAKRETLVPLYKTMVEMKTLDLKANFGEEVKLYQCNHISANNDAQKEILNRDVLKIISKLPYSPSVLNKVVITTGGRKGIKVTWREIIEELNKKIEKAENASKLSIDHLFPFYDIESPSSVLKLQRADKDRRALASFGADFIICDMPTDPLFTEEQIRHTFQTSLEKRYLDVKNYEFFEGVDRYLYGSFMPIYLEHPFFESYMIYISRIRYAVAKFLQYMANGRLQKGFEEWKQDPKRKVKHE